MAKISDDIFMENEKSILIIDGQPCKHKGCEKHITHPCEGCGRIGAKGEVTVIYDKFDIEFGEKATEQK